LKSAESFQTSTTNFFMSNLESVLEDRLSPEDHKKHLREVETIFPDKMNEIRVMQLRLGKKFSRWGIDLSEIASSIPLPEGNGAPEPTPAARPAGRSRMF